MLAESRGVVLKRRLAREMIAILSDARRGIKGGGVRVDSETVAEEHATLGEGTWVLQRGRRRFARVTVTPTP